MCRSPYDGDLTPLWNTLNAIEHCEKNERWGGHAGAGGSPRGIGSKLSPTRILRVLWVLTEKI